MKPSLILLTGGTKTKHTLHQQLQQLLGDYLHIDSYAVDEGLPAGLEADVILFSSESLKEEVGHIKNMNAATFITGQRTVHHEHLDKLLTIPTGANVLVINDEYNVTLELIQSLYQLGINHVRFIAYKKSHTYYDEIDVAVSPGEIELAPTYLPMVLDIGVRLLDMTTILRIVDHCRLEGNVALQISERYIRSIIELQQKLLVSQQETKEVYHHIQNVVNTIDDGILVINETSEVTVFNQKLEALFQIQADLIINRPIDTGILQNEVVQFIRNGVEESQFFSIHGVEVVVYRHTMIGEQSIVAVFKSVHQASEIEKTAQRKYREKGFYAKYSFDDIFCENTKMKELKQIAKKLALAEHPILIQGESGTGKELFAHAIHKHSLRKSGPFLPINCSALSESLLESELFGYEDGSFTGGQRGGKKGLFELADNGTIFLDEIGDISLSMQSLLLRVIQEKEIRRIGGSKIIPINVRIISATNKKIEEQMKAQTFRNDLFYRLNVLNLSIPPLRERREDIPLLIHHYITKNGKWIKVEQSLMDWLKRSEWDGNIRELKNTLDYMLTVCNGTLLTKDDLPQYQKAQQSEDKKHPQQNRLEQSEHLMILKIIMQCHEAGKAASREYISAKTKEQHESFSLSQQQVRRRLDDLEQKGMIIKRKGRGGTRITEAGISYLESLR
ncbi:sigma 54-interacting transcriptional regulator [Peribacillus muralis]|uniref:sigma 54-interacting transcriptional regulator n=1 Tax=Peribacillus muralis TaxID=264697 RepID=UPI00070A5B04|nr:sigma 54-interacting transcriptional regulator [Peribacillus muralis]